MQDEVERQLSRVLRADIRTHGCGRTDAGVHADQFYLQFHCPSIIDFDLPFRLNKMLPDDIAVFDLHPVAAEAHVQHDVVDRTYQYQLHTRKDPFLQEVSALYPGLSLDLAHMHAALGQLEGSHDFYRFAIRPDVYKDTYCQLSQAALVCPEEGRYTFTFTADRFLRGMVRNLVGALLALGQGRLSFEAFCQPRFDSETRLRYKMAYLQGLHLVQVRYPYLLDLHSTP